MANFGSQNERQPLLINNEKKRFNYKALKSAFLLFFCMLFGVVLTYFTFTAVYYVKPRLGDGISQGVDFTLEKVKFLGLQDQTPGQKKEGGLLFGIKGEHHNDFDRIEDKKLQYWFKYVGGGIKGIQLRITSLNLGFIEDDGKENDELTNLGTFQIQPFYVRTSNNATTDLNLETVFWPDANGVGKVLRRYMKDANSIINIRGDALVDIYLINGYVNIGIIKVPLDFEIGASYAQLLN